MKSEQSRLLRQEYKRLKHLVNLRYDAIRRIKGDISFYIYERYYDSYKDKIDSCYKELVFQREVLKELEITLKTFKKLMKLTK